MINSSSCLHSWMLSPGSNSYTASLFDIQIVVSGTILLKVREHGLDACNRIFGIKEQSVYEEAKTRVVGFSKSVFMS